jgi:hypothetical protein
MGKLDRDARSLENVAVYPQKPIHHLLKERRGSGEGRLEKILNDFSGLIGEDGWNHVTHSSFFIIFVTVLGQE